ncbi:gag-polypeptide of LTR copia-type [Sesbania bispinosa]|nr:gag-polypeptide of LTR copia-type [Sesbania bispinosa]
MALLLNKNILPDISRLEPLDGTNYKRWSQRLLIFFEQLEVDYVLFKESPIIPSEGYAQVIEIEMKKFENHEKHNKLILEKKYGADDAGNRKYVTEKWLQFQMVDDKPIMEQVHEYENLVADVLNEGMKMCEILQANVLLEKFPPSWNEFRNHLKHKKKDFTLQELISYMRTEEANRLKDKYHSIPSNLSNVNLVESVGNSVREKFKRTAGKKNLQHKWQDKKQVNKPNTKADYWAAIKSPSKPCGK